MDTRLTAGGMPIVVKVKANPYLERTSALPLAALPAGMGHASQVNRIVEIARKCWEPKEILKNLWKCRSERARTRQKAE